MRTFPATTPGGGAGVCPLLPTDISEAKSSLRGEPNGRSRRSGRLEVHPRYGFSRPEESGSGREVHAHQGRRLREREADAEGGAEGHAIGGEVRVVMPLVIVFAIFPGLAVLQISV